MRENRDKRKKGIDTSIYKFIYKENPLYQFILNIVYLQYQFSLLYMNSSPRKFLYYINICSQPGGDDAAAPGEAEKIHIKNKRPAPQEGPGHHHLYLTSLSIRAPRIPGSPGSSPRWRPLRCSSPPAASGTRRSADPRQPLPDPDPAAPPDRHALSETYTRCTNTAAVNCAPCRKYVIHKNNACNYVLHMLRCRQSRETPRHKIKIEKEIPP